MEQLRQVSLVQVALLVMIGGACALIPITKVKENVELAAPGGKFVMLQSPVPVKFSLLSV